MSIRIQKSKTAFNENNKDEVIARTTKEDLLESTRAHIKDVGGCITFFSRKMLIAAIEHDADKKMNIDEFFNAFKGGFKDRTWFDNHCLTNRHHLVSELGIPADVNLLDVLEYIADCVSAGVARNGKENVYCINLSPELLKRAFSNTVQLLLDNVEEAEGIDEDDV